MQNDFDIFRDEYGVPHIDAENRAGTFTGLGYAHGRDRGMQMLFMRILGNGRVSELLDSSESSLGVDTFFRRMNWAENTTEHLQELTPAASEMLDAYCAGVNQALTEKPPWELRLVGYRPEPWRPEDTFLIARMTGYLTLSQSQAEIERLLVELVQAGVSDEKLSELFPGLLEGMDRELIEQVELAPPYVVPRDLWETGAPRMTSSNSWVITGSRTSSGAAILANDPHLETNRLPNIWYEVVMSDGERWGAGSTMPGLPGLLVGRTSRVSVGATYSHLDAEDSWIERCREGEYEREGEGWKPFSVRTETILRKKKEPVTVTFYENHHGVLAGDPTGPDEKYLLCAGWTGSKAGAASVNAMEGVWSADTVSEAMDALGPARISFNWVFADVDGNIGYQMSGAAPIRRPGWRGLVPLPGWLPENDWQGIVPHTDMPREINPDRGYIHTANNDLNHLGKLPVITVPSPSYRADRIEQLLTQHTGEASGTSDSAGPGLQAAQMNRMQGDLYSLQAGVFMEILRPLLPQTAAAAVLREWDCRYNPESRGATLFERFYAALRAEVFGGVGLGPKAEDHITGETGVYGELLDLIDRILLAPESAWFGGRSRDELWRAAAERVLNEVGAPWADSQKIIMSHILFGGTMPGFLGFDRGPIVLQGGRATINQGQIYRSAGRTTSFAPSLRLATDMGTTAVHSNLAGGPSEHRFSRWYTSDLERWRNNEYKTLSPDYGGKRIPFG
jgi:penicillin amidase